MMLRNIGGVFIVHWEHMVASEAELLGKQPANSLTTMRG